MCTSPIPSLTSVACNSVSLSLIRRTTYWISFLAQFFAVMRLLRVGELITLVTDFQLSLRRDTAIETLKIIADAQKKALEVYKHLAYNLNDQFDTVYTDLVNMTLLVYSQAASLSACASAPAASSSSVGFGASPASLPEAPTSAGNREHGMGTCQEDEKLQEETPSLTQGEHVQPEHMQLILSVSQKLISLKSDLNREGNREDRDRVIELLAMLVDCNISPRTNKIIKIIVAVMKKAPEVVEQLPRHLQAKMREVHNILLDVILLLVKARKGSLTLPSDHSSSVGSSDSIADSASLPKSPQTTLTRSAAKSNVFCKSTCQSRQEV